MSNFWVRAITGTIFVAVIVSAILFKSWIFHTIFGLVGILGLNEYYALFKKSPTNPHHTLGLLLGIAIYCFGIAFLYFPSATAYFVGFVIFTFPLIAFAELYRKKINPFENVSVTLTGIIYTILPMLLLNFIIQFDHATLTITHFWPALSLFILVWCNDTFAYLIGRSFGKNKLFERISPKKSWEGFFGGLVFSMLGGFLIAYFTDQSLAQYLLYGAVIGVFGTIGDLIQSMLKRSLAVKDSGNILPGHGGILDRFDGVLFVTPIIFFLDRFVF